MTKIIYIVHSTTIDNERGIASGRTNTNLSERGIQQARNLHGILLLSLEEFGKIYCSPLQRAIRTAIIIFPKNAIHYDSRLMEMDYGELSLEPADKINKISLEYIKKQMPHGESYQDVANRMLAFLQEHRDEDVITIVAHQATQLALEVLCNKKDWETAFATNWRLKKEWQPFWVYEYTERDSKIGI